MTLQRVRPGWLARSIDQARNLPPETQRWIAAVRANFVKGPSDARTALTTKSGEV